MNASTLPQWNWLRVLRLAVGAAFLYEGWRSGSGLAYAIGAFFMVQGAFNMGCPMLGACTAPPTSEPNATRDVTFEEVL